ncbi:MAG: phosphoribosylformylglycinamidine cyclo-ligase [Patescibacteria group bacterium]
MKKKIRKKITYAQSGVDIEAGDRAVDLVKKKIHETFGYFPGKVLTKIGAFGGVAELKDGRIVASSTDGVGTKLIVASLMNKHATVGIDLVAMSVNDIAVLGIRPALFLDYIAMGKQIPERTKQIMTGIIRGCHEAEVALLGGEMAEMPDMYSKEEYDLAGFAVGFCDSKRDLILGQHIKPGMKVYGFPSSGVHSNGYSLVRKVFGIDFKNPKRAKKILRSKVPGLALTLGETLLTPTKIYVNIIQKLLAAYDIAGLVHITGGGLVENPPRVLPPGCAMKIRRNSWKQPRIFDAIRKTGNVSEHEMLRTFNCGIGLVVVSRDVIKEGILIGEIIRGRQEVIFE